MVRPPALILGAVLLSGCLHGAPRVACETLSGSIAETMTGPSTASGTITGSLNGSIAIEIDSTWTTADGFQVFRARHTIITTTGDTLRTSDEGTMVPLNATSLRINNSITPVTGTGRFRAATGSIITDGELNIGNAAVALRYQGELCTQNSKPASVKL